MPDTKQSCRTVAEWAIWAQSEGFQDMVEKSEEGSPSVLYCTLCAKSLAASSKGIKSHCVGYHTGAGENRKFHESTHAQKVCYGFLKLWLSFSLLFLLGKVTCCYAIL